MSCYSLVKIMQGDISEWRVALVHDELTRRGGAERVLEEIIDLFPQADIFALYAGTPRLEVNATSYAIRTTFLQKMPRWFRRHPRRLLPLLPYAAEQIDVANYDVVISSASAFAKGIVTRANIPHLCYCHTPARFLWDTHNDVIVSRRWPTRAAARLLFHALRVSDFAAAQRVDHFLANSRWTQQRIASYYRRTSEIIYPPIDTTFFTPGVSGKHQPPYFLCVGRLTGAKHFEQAVTVCEKLGISLVIIGTGEERKHLEHKAGSKTKFIGQVNKETLRLYMRGAMALLQPAEEDFGMASVEALACGTPVIAYGTGGASEVISPWETGIVYDARKVEALAEAIRQFLNNREVFKTERLQRRALDFSRDVFRQHFIAKVKQAVEESARRG